MATNVSKLLDALPASVKVGPHVYAIAIIDNVPDDDNFFWGECCEKKQEIKLNGALPTREFAMDTVIHEILHAVSNTRSIQFPANEETIAESFAVGLLSLFQDNPALLAWLQKGLRAR